MLHAVTDTAFEMIKKAKKGSIEKRVLRAVIVKALKRNTIQALCRQHKTNGITSGTIRLQINRDIPTLLEGKPLSKNEFSRESVPISVVKDAVSFILHRDNIVTTAWGEQSFVLSTNENVTLPRLCRKLPRKDIWNSYDKADSDIGSIRKVGRSTFYYLMNDLTISGKSIVNAVDYVQSLLVLEPIEDRKSTRLNSSHSQQSRMPSSA